jgi:hypothetical protein
MQEVAFPRIKLTNFNLINFCHVFPVFFTDIKMKIIGNEEETETKETNVIRYQKTMTSDRRKLYFF